MFSRRLDLDAAVARDEWRPHLKGLVAAGGDGTLLDVLNRHPEWPAAVLPLGTENLVARWLGVRCCGRSVARMIAADRRLRLDVGLCEGRRFLVMASAGWDAAVMHRAQAARRGRITRLAYLAPILATLAAGRSPEIEVCFDDEPTPIRGRIVIVANLPTYALRLNPAAEALGDDGLFDVVVLPEAGPWSLLRAAIMFWRGKGRRIRGVLHRRAACIRLGGAVAAPMQMDGEASGSTPATIRLLPGAAELFVPEGAGLGGS